MLNVRHVVLLLFVCTMGFGAGAGWSQDYPHKTIRIVTSPPGGGGDIMSRLIAQEISTSLGQPVIVDNRVPTLIGELVAQAPPDGYTILLLGNILWMEPLVRKTSHDPVRDFAPISMVGTAPNVLVVHPSLPVKSAKELIGLAKSNPGALNYGSTGAGSNAELAAELFKSMAGINVVGIPYKAAGLATNALIGGEVQLLISDVASVTPHVKSGRLRALAVTSPRASMLAPDLPTLAATLPGFESVVTYIMAAPAKTPGPIVKQLNEEILRVMNRPDVKARFLAVGVEAVGSPSDELANYIKADMARWSKVIKDSGIKTQ